jgi:cell division protein FtsW (lipid II flippase)
MFKNRRYFVVIVMLLAVVSVNVAMPAQALPCYDLWQGFLSGGGGSNYCEGMWCGCMYSQYGYACAAQVQ